MPTHLNFGIDPPPLEDPSTAMGKMSAMLTQRRDGMTVEEDFGEVAHQLATAGRWPRFTQRAGSGTRPVYVNPAFVRFLIEED